MSKSTIVSISIVALAFLLGLMTLSGMHGEDRGWAGIGIIFLLGPSILGVSLIALVVAFLTKSRAFMGYTLTAMLAILAWIVGVIVAG